MIDTTQKKLTDDNITSIIGVMKGMTLYEFCDAVKGKACDGCDFRFVCEEKYNESYIRETYPEMFL